VSPDHGFIERSKFKISWKIKGGVYFMPITRRQFLKVFAGTGVAVTVSGNLLPEIVSALEKAAAGNPPVLWIQGEGCTGCSVSLLNTTHPTIAEVLLNIISLKFHQTVMAASGQKAYDYLWESAAKNYGKYFLVTEGSIGKAFGGRCCLSGEREGKEVAFTDLTMYLGKGAAGVLALGQCGFGGIPGAQPNPTNVKSVRDFFKDAGIKTPVINIPGCPPHPDWVVGTIAHVLMFGIPELDSDGRPTMFYGTLVHDNCPYRSYYDENKFAKFFGDEGCRVELGCKGPESHADCWKRGWNDNVNWCVHNSLCLGCTEPGWPDNFSPFYVKTTG
jgi:hydrogenase small subunit